MAYNKLLLEKRNTHIVSRYRHLRKKKREWKDVYLIELVAEEMFLSPSTIARIVYNDGVKVPCADTVIKYTRQEAAVA